MLDGGHAAHYQREIIRMVTDSTGMQNSTILCYLFTSIWPLNLIYDQFDLTALLIFHDADLDKALEDR